MVTSAAGAPPPATRWAAVLPPALLLAAGLALAALRFNDVFSLNGDNAWYVVLARNLVTGRPYNNAGFPWGYPALLAPGVALFGPTRLVEAITWLKGLSVLAFLAAIALLYALFRTRHSRAIAALTVALFVVNDVALVFTNDLMTELPYVAASAGALLYWQRRIAPAGRRARRPGGRGRSRRCCSPCPTMCARWGWRCSPLRRSRWPGRGAGGPPPCWRWRCWRWPRPGPSSAEPPRPTATTPPRSGCATPITRS